MELRRPFSVSKQSHVSLSNIPPKTMDPKFIVVLFCVETGALVFNSIHAKASEIHIYNSYNEQPRHVNISSKIYSCFSSINYCIYEHEQLRFLKIIHLIFVLIIVICYFCLFTIILRKWETRKVRHDLGITWYGAIQLLVLLTLALHTLLMVILYERDYINIRQCNKENRLVRGENLYTYVVLSMLEIAYIGFDILNRQASIHAVHQDYEHRARQAEHFLPFEESHVPFGQHLASADSFVTVNQEFLE